MPSGGCEEGTLSGAWPSAWEYMVMTTHVPPRHNEMLEECLNKHGQDGWMLVCMHELAPTEFRCVFRKPKP